MFSDRSEITRLTRLIKVEKEKIKKNKEKMKDGTYLLFVDSRAKKRSRQSSTYIFYIEKESPFKKAPFWAIYDFRYVFFWFSRQFFFFSSFLLRDQVAAWDARILIYLRGKFLNAIRRGYHGLLLNRDRYWFQSTSICILIYCFLIKNTKGKKKTSRNVDNSWLVALISKDHDFCIFF